MSSIGSSTTTTNTNMKYSPFAMDAVSKGDSSEIICKAYRDALYNKTKLGEDMKEKIQELRDYVRERFYENAQKNGIILPSRRALNITTENLLQHQRSRAESRAGTSTIGQCNNSIGKKQPTWHPRVDDSNFGNDKTWHESLIKNDNENWEKRTCWLCGFPLQTYGKKDFIGVDCEHKLAMLIMMLIGAGLKKTKPRAGIKDGDTRDKKIQKMIQNSDKKKKVVFQNRTKFLHPDWKILVRSEGYAWSHSYCNQYKSQIPFISLKYSKDAINKYEYVIEINNILQYIGGLFDVTDDELKSIFKWYTGGPKPDENNENWKEYGNTKMKPVWKKHINLDRFMVGTDKVKTIKNAFNNIIDMLIPTYFLLNIGEGIDHDIEAKAKEYFQNNKDQEEPNKDRSFVEYMKKIPIKARLQDNIGRILGWLSKGKQSKIDNIIEKITNSNVNNPITKYLKEKKDEEELKEDEGVLELFDKGAWSLETIEEEKDGGDDLIDLVKERESESDTPFFSLEVPGKRKHRPRPLLSGFEHSNILGRRSANNISPTPEKIGASSTEREGLKRGNKKKKGDKGRELWKQAIPRGGRKRTRRKKRRKKRKRTRRKKRKRKRSKKKRRRKKRTRRRR